jgi:hypothetical protein
MNVSQLVVAQIQLLLGEPTCANAAGVVLIPSSSFPLIEKQPVVVCVERAVSVNTLLSSGHVAFRC